jgi:ABC-type Fe3+ transport system permease subunit
MSRPLAVAMSVGVLLCGILVLAMELGPMLLSAAPAVRAPESAQIAFSVARRHCVAVSAVRATTAALIGVALAAVVAGFASYCSDRARRAMAILLMLPLLSSAAPRLFVLRGTLGVSGVVNRIVTAALGGDKPTEWLLFSNFSVVAGLVIDTLPFCALFALGALRAANGDIFNVCAELHVGAWRRFWDVTVPVVFSAAATGGLIAFAVSFGSSLENAFLGESRCSLPDAIVSLWRGEQFDAAALLGGTVALTQFAAFAVTVAVMFAMAGRVRRQGGQRWVSAYLA